MMKKRASLKDAEYSIKRAKEYQRMCEEILYNRKWEVAISGDKVYLKSNGENKFLVEISNPKTAWFEIWLKLKDI